MSDDRMNVQERVAAMRSTLSTELEAHSVAAMNVMTEATRMTAEATAAGPEAAAAGMDKLSTDLKAMAVLAARAMAERERGSPQAHLGAVSAPIEPRPGPSVGGGQVPVAEPEVLEDVLEPGDLSVPSNPAVRDAVRLAVPMINNFVRDVGRARIVLETAFLDRTEGADAALKFIVLKAEVVYLLGRLERQALARLNEWTLYFQQRPDRVLKAAALSSFQDLADSLTTMDAKAAMSVQTAASEVVAGYASVKGKMAEVWSAIDVSKKQKDNVRQLYG